VTPPLTPDLESVMRLAESYRHAVYDRDSTDERYEVGPARDALRSALVSLYARIQELETANGALRDERDSVAVALQRILDHVEDLEKPGTCMCCHTYRMIGHDAIAALKVAPLPWETPLSTPQTQEGSEA
jgi:hypothetical protein